MTRIHQLSEARADVLDSPDGTTVPPVPRTRGGPSRLRWWAARAALVLGALLLTGAAAGVTYESVAAARDAAANPPPGRLVDVGGYRLHVNCAGQGSPTVILESGLANRSADWDIVQPQVATTTRVCAYDRAGIGWSDTGPEPRDSVRIAGELHTLLANAGVPGPYVLAGHSFGGLYTRMYAGLYPDQVVGMALVDASHPDQWTYAPPEFRASAQPSAAMGLAYRAAQRLGVARLANLFPVPSDCGHPAPYCAEERAYRNARFMDSYVAEMGAPERDAQVRAAPSLGDRPLIVLTAGDHSDQGLPPQSVAQFERDWRHLQADLAVLSTNSEHLLIEGSRHGTLQTTYAAVPSDAIRRVVDASRTGQPLATAAREPGDLR
jgi:pimeloyl-ACP methyl ester carboxylesterase